MLQKFAMVKYGVFVAKICKHALCASTVRDIWWSPLARQLLPPWSLVSRIISRSLFLSLCGSWFLNELQETLSGKYCLLTARLLKTNKKIPKSIFKIIEQDIAY